MSDKQPRNRSIGEIFRDGTSIDAALKCAFRETVLRHKLLGEPMVFWDGKCVVHINAEDLVVPSEPRNPTEGDAA